VVDEPGIIEAELLEEEPVVEKLGEWTRLRGNDPEPECDSRAILRASAARLRKRHEFAIANDSQ
jgi:hypothetical protein